MINNIKNNYAVKTILPFFEKQEFDSYIVGGFLRDAVLGKTGCDVDIAVPGGRACSVAKSLADSISGYFVELDNINNIYRVVFEDKKNYVDIADCAGCCIEEDLKRRDFTMNALAYDIKNDRIIDVTGGAEDIRHGVIREISAFNITDDPIRILRAFRFQSELGFEMTESLTEIVKEHACLLQNTAKERVNAELVKLFGGAFSVFTLMSMDCYGLLEQIFPCVNDMRKIPPNSHHHLGLLEHSFETVKQVQIFYDNAAPEVKEHLDERIFGVYNHKRLAYLKIAAFLHDIGKPQTWQIEPDTGRHRFIMHDSLGAKIAEPLLRELKFSKKQIAYIQKIIKNHIYPAGVVTADEATQKAYLRFYRKMENEVIDLIAVAYADRMSALGPEITQEMLEKNIKGLETLLDGYLKEKNKLAPLPKLLDGHEIMKILDISASPALGEIISKLNEAQLNSEVNTKEQAIEFVKGLQSHGDSETPAPLRRKL